MKKEIFILDDQVKVLKPHQVFMYNQRIATLKRTASGFFFLEVENERNEIFQ
jgi:hypothetical protein